MKKILNKSLVLFLALTFVVMSVLPVSASQATSYSYTLDDEGDLVRTQDAYLPDRTITDLGLQNPEDMVIDENNFVYIADTGNARIVVYNLDTEKVVKILNKDSVNDSKFSGFKNPKGIYRTKNGELYIAILDPILYFSGNLTSETHVFFILVRGISVSIEYILTLSLALQIITFFSFYHFNFLLLSLREK